MRTTEEMKDCVVKIRLSEELKGYIDKASKRNGSNTSEYIRELIRADMKRSEKN